MVEGQAPPFRQWFRGDREMEVDVFDYEGTYRSTHSYLRDIKRDRRDKGCGWAYRPEAWFWETRPIYPYHWHVFLLREAPPPRAP